LPPAHWPPQQKSTPVVQDVPAGRQQALIEATFTHIDPGQQSAATMHWE
jgi:hypothetical protein